MFYCNWCALVNLPIKHDMILVHVMAKVNNNCIPDNGKSTSYVRILFLGIYLE